MPVSALKNIVNTYCGIHNTLLFLTECDTRQELPRSHKQTPAGYSTGAFPDTYLGKYFHTLVSRLAASPSWQAPTWAAVSTPTEQLPAVPTAHPRGRSAGGSDSDHPGADSTQASLHVGTPDHRVRGLLFQCLTCRMTASSSRTPSAGRWRFSILPSSLEAARRTACSFHYRLCGQASYSRHRSIYISSTTSDYQLSW